MDCIDNHVGGLIKLLSDKMKASADANMKKKGLTFQQCRILWYLDDQGGMASQKEIEDHLKVAHPTVVGIVSRLEKNGFVRSRVQEKDRRVKLVEATEKANAIHEDLRRDRKETEALMTEGFSQEEIDLLQKLLYKMYRNFDMKEE